VRASIRALAAEDTPGLIDSKFPFGIEREDFAGADTDARPAVYAFALIVVDAVFEYPYLCAKIRHGIPHKFALVVRYINKCFTFG
jgi:hypothetical protein